MPLRIFAALVAITLVGTPLRAGAVELYLDAYGGVALTEDSRVEARLDSGRFFVASENASATADYDPSFSAGLRGGLWWENVPWIGLAQDVSYFQAESDELEVEVISFSTLLMLRVPLWRSEEFPGGRIFPYAGAGPSVFYADVDADLRPGVSRRISGDAWDIGYQALTGLQWRLDRHWSLFGEYRFTYRDIHVDDGSNCFVCFADESVDTTLKTHHFLLGVSLWF